MPPGAAEAQLCKTNAKPPPAGPPAVLLTTGENGPARRASFAPFARLRHLEKVATGHGANQAQRHFTGLEYKPPINVRVHAIESVPFTKLKP